MLKASGSVEAGTDIARATMIIQVAGILIIVGQIKVEALFGIVMILLQVELLIIEAARGIIVTIGFTIMVMYGILGPHMFI